MIFSKVENKKKSSTKAARVSGVVNYITAPENENALEKCVYHEAVNFISNDLKSQTAEMISLSQEAVKSKDPLEHFVISWKSHERPTPEQASEAAAILVKQCGLTGHQYIIGLHDDTDNMHLHIAVNRVHPDTCKVVKINKGFDLEAGHQAIAIIEKVQGWNSELNARYRTNDKAELIIDPATKRPQIFENHDKHQQPTAKAQAMEIQTGEKSAQRLCIENAAPIIAAATSWKQLHAELAKVGIEYHREGSGAKLLINNTAVKASDVVDRKNNFGALQKRLGLYQPANTPEIKNDPFNRTQLITDTRFETGYDQPHTAATGFSTFDTLLDLPGSNLDVTNTTNQQKSKTQNLLQSHESSDNRGTGRVRRGSNSSGPERSAASQSRQPLKANQPGWTQYQQIKEVNDSARRAERLALSNRHDSEKTELKASQKVEREAALKEVPKGQGAALNEMRGLISDIQKPVMQELQQRHKAEREALQAKYKPLPMYKQWKEQPQIVSLHVRPLIDQHITQDHQPAHVSQIIKQLTQRRDEHRHFTYSLHKKDVFRDEGKKIQILDLNSDQGIAAALATAQQKFGDVLTLTGSDAFKQNAVAVAVEYNLTCRYDDPTLEKLRTQFQAQKDAAVLEAARAERERAAAAQLEKTKALTPAPVHSPIQQTGAAVDPDALKNSRQPARAEELPAVDHLDDIHQQIESAKAAAHHHSMFAHSKTIDADRDAPDSGVIVGGNEQFVAVQRGEVVKLYLTLDLAKNLTYDGIDTGYQMFAPGNEIKRKNGEDGMRTLLSEGREEMQTEAKRERERDRGHGL